MKLKNAIELISPALPQPQPGKVWTDLGSGKGLFTQALATLLGPDSTVHAVDKSHATIESPVQAADIVFHQLDFSEDNLPFADLDGVLMANSLHFVQDKHNLVSRLKKLLQPDGELLIVEYELSNGNAWVPYPIPFSALKALLAESGFEEIRLVGHRRSIYGGRKMYASVARKARNNGAA